MYKISFVLVFFRWISFFMWHKKCLSSQLLSPKVAILAEFDERTGGVSYTWQYSPAQHIIQRCNTGTVLSLSINIQVDLKLIFKIIYIDRNEIKIHWNFIVRIFQIYILPGGFTPYAKRWNTSTFWIQLSFLKHLVLLSRLGPTVNREEIFCICIFTTFFLPFLRQNVVYLVRWALFTFILDKIFSVVKKNTQKKSIKNQMNEGSISEQSLKSLEWKSFIVLTKQCRMWSHSDFLS